MTLNVGEYGKVFVFSVGFDMSSQTALTLVFTKPDGTALTVTDPDVTVGSSTKSVDGIGTVTLNEYVEYTFASGDVDQSGTWTAQLTYDEGAGKRLISEPAQFTVDD